VPKMASAKSLSFDAAEIDELLNLKYAGQRTSPVLSVLYPGLDKARPRGVSDDRMSRFGDHGCGEMKRARQGVSN
jgi:hypothetical protein